MNNQHLTPEHLLLGLCRAPDDVASMALTHFGIVVQELQATLRAAGKTFEPISPMHMTLTPRAKRTIDLAYSEARELQHNYIGTEHLLLAIIRGGGPAADVLEGYGIELTGLRDYVTRIHSGESATAVAEPVPPPQPPQATMPPEHLAARLLFLRQGRLRAEMLASLLLTEPSERLTSALKSLGISPTYLATRVEQEILSFAANPTSTAAECSIGELLAVAAQEAADLGQDLGPEHLLLAVVKDGSNALGRWFSERAVSPDQLREALRS